MPAPLRTRASSALQDFGVTLHAGAPAAWEFPHEAAQVLAAGWYAISIEQTMSKLRLQVLALLFSVIIASYSTGQVFKGPGWLK